MTNKAEEPVIHLTGEVPVEEPPSDALSGIQVHIGTIESVVGVLVLLFAIGVAWGRLRHTVRRLDDTVRRRVLPDLHDVRERLAGIEGKLEAIWRLDESRQTRKTASTIGKIPEIR